MFGNCRACGHHIEQVSVTFPHEIREEFVCLNKKCGKRYYLDGNGGIHERD